MYLNPILYFIDIIRIYRIKQVNVWLQRLLCLTLFFAITVANISTLSLSNFNRDCELFQESCHVLINNYNQPESSFSNTSVSKCIKLNRYKIPCLFSILDFKLIPLSGSDTCQCSNNAHGQVLMFRPNIHNSSSQRPICITSVTLLYNFDSSKMILWEGTVSFFPPDHLKSISTTIIIV